MQATTADLQTQIDNATSALSGLELQIAALQAKIDASETALAECDDQEAADRRASLLLHATATDARRDLEASRLSLVTTKGTAAHVHAQATVKDLESKVKELERQEKQAESDAPIRAQATRERRDRVTQEQASLQAAKDEMERQARHFEAERRDAQEQLGAATMAAIEDEVTRLQESIEEKRRDLLLLDAQLGRAKAEAGEKLSAWPVLAEQARSRWQHEKRTFDATTVLLEQWLALVKTLEVDGQHLEPLIDGKSYLSNLALPENLLAGMTAQPGQLVVDRDSLFRDRREQVEHALERQRSAALLRRRVGWR